MSMPIVQTFQMRNLRASTLCPRAVGEGGLQRLRRLLFLTRDLSRDRSRHAAGQHSGQAEARIDLRVPELVRTYIKSGSAALRRDGAARAALWLMAPLAHKFSWALSAYHVGRIEMTAGNYPAAERVLAEGREALIAIGERGVLSSILAQLAEAAYAQGHLDAALQLTEESDAISAAGDIDARARWRATRARVPRRDDARVQNWQQASQQRSPQHSAQQSAAQLSDHDLRPRGGEWAGAGG